MNKKEIVNELARRREVEKVLATQAKYATHPYIDDLAQDIYMILLDDDDELIERLYEKNEILFYIVRIVKNNLYSTTSQFFYKYQKFRKLSNELNEKY